MRGLSGRETLRKLMRSRGEDGATIIIVVLSLVALFAMIVLAVDVGGLLLRQRAMVNGADAAALAAAKSCASTSDTDNPEAQADLFAIDNVSGLVASNGQITQSANCDTNGEGYVTVEYTKQQDLFFAGVLGFGSSAAVRAEATAGWGPPGSGNPVPVVLNTAAFQGPCAIPLPDSAIGQECYLWYDNDRFDGGNFGFLALDQWDVSPSYNCNASGGSNVLEDWINGLYSGPQLGLNFPQPTYVCTTPGNRQPVWNTLEGRVGDTLTFPINDWDGSVTGSPQIYNNAGTQVDLYNIIGFASLRVEDVLRANQVGSGSSACGNRTQSFTPTTLNIDLDNWSFTCLPYDDLVNVQLTRQGGGPQCCTPCTTPTGGTPSGCHYYYDQASHVIDWLDGTRSVRITWDSFENGLCGSPPPNNSAHCLIVSWQGYQYGGGDAGGGADFGVRAISLCDRDFASCPDQN